jgi:F0F1-type ATP synthase assembly protein I
VAAGGLLGTFAGYGLDRWLGTAPGFLIGGLLLGLAGGAVGAWRLLAEYLER